MNAEEALADIQAELVPVYKVDGTRVAKTEIKVEPYDFRNPGFLNQADIRQLTTIHEKLVQNLSARLSTFLRMECMIKIRRLSSPSFSKFREGIKSPTHLTLFQVDPLRGVGVLEMSLPLALAMADRLLGGRGNSADMTRSLTEIEVALVEDLVVIFIDSWAQQWNEDNRDFQTRCIGNETTGAFLLTSAPETVTLVVELEVSFGSCTEMIHLAVPFSMIETAVRKMQRSPIKAEESQVKKIEWRVPYEEIVVPVTAEWVVKEISVAEILTLQVGDVLEMPFELVNFTRVRFSQASEFIGTVGIDNGRVAVQLTKRISSAL